MRLYRQMFFLVLVNLLVLGCAKKSGIEGKVFGTKGQPIPNVKIIAQQVQPIKGYEHFETTTSSDGTFRFKNVFPSSEYTLSLHVGTYEIKKQIPANSAPEGQISMLPSPIVIPYPIENPFTSIKDGVITDYKTGLLWAQDAGQKMTWNQANDYVHNLKLGGYSDWRLPSKEELESLVSYANRQGINEDIYELFGIIGFKNVQSYYYWSSSSYADYTNGAWIVSMWNGHVSSSIKSNYNYYVWPVRSGQ